MPLLSSLKDLMLLPLRATSSIKPNTLVAAAKPRKPPGAVFVMGLTVHGGG